MTSSQALRAFEHAIQDSTDLLEHFDKLNGNRTPNIEVLKRASLVMALAALETYFEDRIEEAVKLICDKDDSNPRLSEFYLDSLRNDLRFFHSPNADRVVRLFQKYLAVDVSEGWIWNNCDPPKAKAELGRLVKKRGDIAHRSLRPATVEAKPKQHAVTRDDLRKHIHFIKQIANTTDTFLAARL